MSGSTSSETSSHMKQYYYADTNSEPVGPVTLDELHALFSKRVIDHSTPVIVEGDTDWSNYRAMVKEVEHSVMTQAILRGCLNLGIGLFLGLLVGLTFPFRIIKRSLSEVIKWGMNKCVPLVSRREMMSFIGNCWITIFIITITFLCIIDIVTIPVLGSSYFMSLIPMPGFVSAISAAMLENKDFIGRTEVMFGQTVLVYFIVIPFIALIGELFDILATIGGRTEAKSMKS
jgi:hypothetical protein